MSRRRHTEGFTLIELLIVIIIIGILAAIAIPMFLSQRNKAKDSAVKGAAHAIELGLATYAIDHGDAYPATLPDGTLLVDGAGTAYVTPWPANPWTGERHDHMPGTWATTPTRRPAVGTGSRWPDT